MTLERPRIVFDLTLSVRSMAARPFGILRVERSIAEALLDRDDLDVAFCLFNAHRRRFLPLSRAQAETVLGFWRRPWARQLGSRRSPLRAVLDFLRSGDERRRRGFKWGWATASRAPDRAEAALFDGAAAYLLIGIPWNTHDPGALARLREQHGARPIFFCQDIAPIVHPEFFVDLRPRFEAFLRAALAHAEAIACLSDWTRRDLTGFARAAGLDAPASWVVRPGVELDQAVPARRPAELPALKPRAFVLAVGNVNIRKNHALLLDVWAALAAERGAATPTLVIAGEAGWLADDVLKRIGGDPALAGRVVHLAGVGDAALAWLYRNCRFSVFPSLYEGWGLPVGESLAHGRYCLASNASAIPEAAEGLAGLLDPTDRAAWRGAISALLDDPERLARLDSEIARRYRPRRWRTAADELLAGALDAVDGRVPGGRS